MAKSAAKKKPDQHRETGALDVIGVGDRAGPGKFRLTRSVKQPPIRADAAFHGLPRLVNRLNDIVVDAVSFRARDKIAEQHGLVDSAGIGVVKIVTRAWPAEFGNDNPLSGVHPAQAVIGFEGAVDGIGGVETGPVRQDVRGDKIDRRCQFRVIDPGRPKSPVLTGTGLDLFTRWMSLMRSSTPVSVCNIVSLPTMIALTLLLCRQDRAQNEFRARCAPGSCRSRRRP